MALHQMHFGKACRAFVGCMRNEILEVIKMYTKSQLQRNQMACCLVKQLWKWQCFLSHAA